MRVVCSPAPLQGCLQAIPSKSDAHRVLIAAALADGPTRVRMPGWGGEDIAATLRCLRALGADFVREEHCLKVDPLRNCPDSPVLDCGESGSTLRFLLPVVAALGCGAVFTGAGRLPQRPIGPLLDALCGAGIRFDGDHLPLRLSGKLQSREYWLPGQVSSQFITGLLLALPLLQKGGAVALGQPLESAGYVGMTLKVLRRFSVEVETSNRQYRIPPGQGYRTPGEVEIEGDWSNMAIFLAGGALGGSVCCSGLSPFSAQGDKAVIELLSAMGAIVSCTQDKFCVASGTWKPACDIDVRDIPDLVPVLAAVAAFAPGETCFVHAARLRLKESDRLRTTAQMVCGLGGQAHVAGEELHVRGAGTLPGGCVDSAGDHRIVMAAAIAAAYCRGETMIVGAEAANKSYPTFFEDYQKLGGIYRVVNSG